MGGFGRCCCSCECLPVEDLPTVTISGYTGGGWGGSCCYEQTFTPTSTPSWSKSCSGMLYEGSVAETCVTQHWKRLTPDYRGFEFFPGGCESIPEDFCCPDGAEHIATTTTSWAFTDNAFIAVWRRPKHIIVRISQEDVDCTGIEGQTGGCKIVIRSRYVYDYTSKVYQNQKTAITQTVTMVNDSCFEPNPDHVFDDPGVPVTTCSDVPSDPPLPSALACVYQGTFYFDRVRYYDTMPTGAIEFTNSNVPGCDSTSCNYEPYSYVNSVCIYGPTSTVNTSDCVFSLPCYCAGTIVSLNPTVTSDTVTCIGESVNEIAGCFDDPCVPANCGNVIVTLCQNPGDPPLFETDCADYFTGSAAGFLCTGGGNYRSGVGGDGFLGGPFVTTASEIKYLSCGGCATDLCYFLSPNQADKSYPYLETSDCFTGNCNPECCRSYDDCTCCDETCLPKYGQSVSTVTSHTRTQSCTGLQSASVCTNAPSWTITLA